MVLTGETREMQENATPAKEPDYREESQKCGSFSFCFLKCVPDGRDISLNTD
jgi:hypothetical protein